MTGMVALSPVDFLIRFFVCVLAIYRVAYDLAEQDGFARWCFYVREFVMRRTTASSWERGFIRCPLCWSMTIATFVVPVLFPVVSIAGYLLTVLSLSGGVLLFHFVTLYLTTR